MLEQLVNALAATGYQFAHHAWSNAPAGDYGTYSEDSGNDLLCDGVHGERGTDCWVHYFTRDDTEAPRETIEAALNSIPVSWYLNSVQYENDTGFIHYEWGVGVYG